MFTDSKITIAGNFIDILRYGRKIWHGQLPKSRPSSGERKRSKNGSRCESSIFRAKGNLKKLINANAWQWFDENGKVFIPIFLTLTFAENVTDTKIANYEFTKFIQRFNYEIIHKKSYLQYSVVIEFQKRGAVHYHLVFYNLPFIKDLKNKLIKIWGNGFTNYRKIKNIKNVGSYMCKYMTKELDGTKLYGQKCYFSSRGLHKPVTKNNPGVGEYILAFLPSSTMVYEKIFDSKYCKSVHYRQYDLTNEQELKKTLLAFIQ